MMLLFGTALFSVFFFLTLYVQTVWGYSAIKAGLAWLPFPITLIVVNIIVARVLVTRIGVRPLLMAGPLLAGAGFLWLSRLSETGSYWTHHAAAVAGRQRRHGHDVRAADADGRVAREAAGDRRRLRPAQHRAADRRRDRPGGDRHDRLDVGRAQRDEPADGGGRGGGLRGSRGSGASSAAGASASGAAGVPTASSITR